MKRIALILATFVLAVVVLFALLVALLPRDVLKARIGQQIAGWTGREVSLRGEPEVSFFPRLSVTLNDVRVEGPPEMVDADIIAMDRLTGTIKLLPLIIGRVEVGSFLMERPEVRLVRDADGNRNWVFDSGAAALQLAFAGDVPLGDFRLKDGTVIYENRMSGAGERLDSVNLSIEWTSVRQPLMISGSGVWREEDVAASFTALTPFDAVNGDPTQVEARLDAEPVSVIFSGRADDFPAPQLAGGLKISTPSLREFMAWLGSPIRPGTTLSQASLFGEATFADRALDMQNAEFTLDGNSASGALKIYTSVRPDIAGTLAFDTLDLSPYFAGLGDSLSTTSDWRAVAIDTGWFSEMSADIRLSAGAVELGSLSAGTTAASVSLRDSKLEIGLARADLNGGSVTGDLAVTHSAATGRSAVAAQLRAKNVELSGVAELFGLAEPVTGKASAVIDVTSQGRDLGALVGGLKGTARLGVKDGAVPLFGIAEIASVADDAIVPEPEERLAAMPVTAVSTGFTFAGGVGVLERAAIATPSFSTDVKGWIGLLDGSLGLNGTLRRGDGAAEDDEGLLYTIEGTLPRPIVRPAALAN